MDKSVGKTFERWPSAIFFIRGPRYTMICADLAKQWYHVSGPGTGDEVYGQTQISSSVGVISRFFFLILLSYWTWSSCLPFSFHKKKVTELHSLIPFEDLQRSSSQRRRSEAWHAEVCVPYCVYRALGKPEAQVSLEWRWKCLCASLRSGMERA